MSFVVDAVKKVFKKVKKFVKRVVKSNWFKVVAIAALTLFTAGVAAGGWAAFAGVNSVGSFFGAVGSTMANGWTAISSFAAGNGFTAAGTSAAESAAAGVGAEAVTAAVDAGVVADTGIGVAGIGVGGGDAVAGTAIQGAAGSGVLTPAAQAAFTGGSSALGKIGGSIITQKAAETGAKTFLGKLVAGTKNVFMGSGAGSSFARNAVVSGISGYFQQKDLEKQEFYFRNRTVWGGKAFGGTSEPIDLMTPMQRAKSIFEQTPQMAEATGQGAPTPEQTFGANNQLTPQSQGPQPGSYEYQMAQRSATAAMPQPGQAPPTNRAQPQNRGLLFTPENAGVYDNAV